MKSVAILEAANQNLARIIAESDSLQVVQAISNRVQGSSLMDLLVDDIHVLLRDFVDSQVCYVCRTANVAAHGMARLAVSSSIDFCWYEEPLNLIVEAISDVA
ncbi:hypothetical protein DVH24_002966 [Malus domestica]|uniref:RNase H type-1 domain-containing protein n=1 Tax=Malus domestica TaxID=3750 RepID=A0A498K669_MALDO|nr:hypothetical protein DVH24_002966 [Malus domestica]